MVLYKGNERGDSLMVVHFIGVRDAQMTAAQRVWGEPDFWHMHHDWRSHGDIDWEHDTVVIGSRGTIDPIEWTWQDHELH